MSDNDAEASFDEYLRTMGYSSEPIPTLKTPTSDRKVNTPEGSVIAEIKGFRISQADIEFKKWFQRQGHSEALWGATDLDRVDVVIQDGRKQLARPEYASMPRVLVIVASPHVDTSDLIVQAVMYGYPGIGVSGGPSKEKDWPIRKQGRLRNPGGPVSAVAVLDEVCPGLSAFRKLLEAEREHVEREPADFGILVEKIIRDHPELELSKRVPSLTVHENMFAAMRLPRTIFWGPHDRRCGIEEAWYQDLSRDKYYTRS